jgi:microcystin-dependent protein
MVFSDGTNVYLADGGIVTQSVPSGAISAFGMATAPTGWLLCDGTAISRVTYASLFVAIGTVWGDGDGSTTFNIPNLDNMFLRGISATRTIGTYQADTYLNHTHTITDPGHSHLAGSYKFGLGATGNPYNVPSLDQTSVNTTGITINTSTTGGTETRPKNYGVAFCIKT